MAEFDLRRARRYGVSVPVSYWWSASQGPIHSCAGETRDISDSGVSVAAAGECPPIGASIQVTVPLPRLREEGPGMRLLGEGTVVRVENADTPSATPVKIFAASVHFYPERSDDLMEPKRVAGEKLQSIVQ